MLSNSQSNFSVSSLSSRLYQNETDLLLMQSMLMEGRAKTSDWYYFHVGEMMWSFFMVTCHLDPRAFIRLWMDDSNKLVAYAMLGEDPNFDCQVLPEYDWQGIEQQALDWALEQVEKLRRQEPGRWGGKMATVPGRMMPGGLPSWSRTGLTTSVSSPK